MLIKDNIIVEKLNYKTKNISISVALFFMLNNQKVSLECRYIPDKFKILQNSISTYLTALTKSEDFDLENLSARVVEDLYDVAVPKHIEITLKQEIDNINSSITTEKSQPKFKPQARNYF